jgi:hypothetical protein
LNKGRREKQMTYICRSPQNKLLALFIYYLFILCLFYVSLIFLSRFWALRNRGGLKTRGKSTKKCLGSWLITKNVPLLLPRLFYSLVLIAFFVFIFFWRFVQQRTRGVQNATTNNRGISAQPPKKAATCLRRFCFAAPLGLGSWVFGLGSPVPRPVFQCSGAFVLLVISQKPERRKARCASALGMLGVLLGITQRMQ